jgi:uncharacterized protein with HEPN domain
MPHEKDDDALLWDMLDAALAVKKFVASHSFHDYQNDRMLRNAVERNIEIIGEAAGKVSKALRDAHPQIPWRRIAAQRHVIAHEYGELEDELIWKVATNRIPELIALLEPLLPPSGQGPEA